MFDLWSIRWRSRRRCECVATLSDYNFATRIRDPGGRECTKKTLHALPVPNDDTGDVPSHCCFPIVPAHYDGCVDESCHCWNTTTRAATTLSMCHVITATEFWCFALALCRRYIRVSFRVPWNKTFWSLHHNNNNDNCCRWKPSKPHVTIMT